MFSTLSKQTIWGTRILFLVTCFFSIYLFRDNASSLIQKFIYICAPFALLYSFLKYGYKQPLLSLSSFLKPWSPWIASTILFIFAHGSSGLSHYFHLILIFCLLFLGLFHLKIERGLVATILSLNVLILSLVSIIVIMLMGLQTTIIEVNRNVLIPELAALSVVNFIIYLTNRNQLKSNYLRYLLVLSVIVNIISVVLSEVRTAILVYFSIIPVLFVLDRSLLKKYFPLLAIAGIGLIGLFFLTGRMQEGIQNLLQYQTGQSDSSWGIRIELWKQGTLAFKENPIFGWGLSPFQKTLEAGFSFPVNFNAQHYHNDFVNLLVSGGLISAFGWVATNVLLLWCSKNDVPRAMLVIAFLAIGLTENSWPGNYSACFTFMVSWLLLVLSDPRKKNTL